MKDKPGKTIEDSYRLIESLKEENNRLRGLLRDTLEKTGYNPTIPDPDTDDATKTILTVIPDNSQSEATIVQDAEAMLRLDFPDEDPLMLGEAAKAAQAIGLDVGAEIGRGGMGRVLLGKDLGIGREVAVKLLLDETSADESNIRKLIQEIQITGQLEHPNIIPIYQMGRLEDGRLYFQMKRIRGRSLKDVLYGLAMEDTKLKERYSRLRLLSLFMQICLAVDFAHSRGVIHRDLKPENILLGDYGEALVVDWGLAVVLPEAASMRNAVKLRFAESYKAGTVVGTPAYMSPEQARADRAGIGRASDIYSLGAILYELLTLTPPILARDVEGALAETIAGNIEPPSLREPDSQIDGELDEICMKALAKEANERHASARALYEDVEAYFEGSLASERKRREANALLSRADSKKENYQALCGQRDKISSELSALSGQSGGRPELSVRQRMWDLEDDLLKADMELAESFTKTLNFYLMAQNLRPDDPAIRLRLGEMYGQRYLEARRQADETSTIAWRVQLERVNDGAFDEMLKAETEVRFCSTPENAKVDIFRFKKSKRRLIAESVVEDLQCPVSEFALEHGSYLAVFKLSGHAETKLPFIVEGAEKIQIHARLPEPGDLGEGYCLVPAGEVILGGEPDTFGSLDERKVSLPDFALARYPVTVAEYLEFLNDRDYHGYEQALVHAPRVFGQKESYLSKTGDGLFEIPESDDEGDRWLPDWPILGVSYEDALAYIRWLNNKIGGNFRLPTDEEWEKAARGADRRRYPWGNGFDPSFANMRDTMTGRPSLLSVMEMTEDVSPFGVCGLGGNIRDWTSSPVDDSTENLSVRGGAWTTYEVFCRSACRAGAPPTMCAVNIGFRLAKDM